jgi:hypothetical protein
MWLTGSTGCSGARHDHRDRRPLVIAGIPLTSSIAADVSLGVFAPSGLCAPPARRGRIPWADMGHRALFSLLFFAADWLEANVL